MQETDTPMTMEAAAESLLVPAEQEAVEQVEEEVTDAEEVESEEVELEAEEAEGEADFEDAEQDEEDTEEEAEEQPDTFTVKVDGEEREVTLEELTQSFSGQQYIQKGMQEAAETKKQAEAAFQALQQEQARLAQLFQQMQTTGAVPHPGEAPVYDPNDPLGYLDQKAKYDAAVGAYEQQQAQISQVTQQQTQAQKQAMDAYLQEQRQVLERDIPDFADAEKGKQMMSDLRATGERYGFSEQELSQIVDARTVKVLHDAMQFQKLQAGKDKVKAKAKKARPVTKPKAPRKVNADAKRRENLRKQLKETGSVDAAVQLLMGN